MKIQETRGQSETGKKIKKLSAIFSLFIVITSLASFAASIISFVRLENLPLGLVMVAFFPALVIYSIDGCILGPSYIPENEQTDFQHGYDHQYQEPENTLGDEARSRAIQLEDMRGFREEGRARKAGYAAADPAPLTCLAPGSRWRTPQGVGDLPTMVELMKFHTQQAHMAFINPGGGDWESSYPGVDLLVDLTGYMRHFGMTGLSLN